MDRNAIHIALVWKSVFPRISFSQSFLVALNSACNPQRVTKTRHRDEKRAETDSQACRLNLGRRGEAEKERERALKSKRTALYDA